VVVGLYMSLHYKCISWKLAHGVGTVSLHGQHCVVLTLRGVNGADLFVSTLLCA